MKVTRIILKKYLHFQEGLDLDFTYPSNHPTKANQPLEKVCFIGQSGTGKTTLLNLIKHMSFGQHDEINSEDINQDLIKEKVEVFFRVDHKDFSKRKNIDGGFEYLEGKKIRGGDFINDINGLINSSPYLINFPFNITAETENNRKNINTTTESPKEEVHYAKADFDDKEKELKEKKVWDFSNKKIKNNKIQGLSNIIFDKISIYNKEYLKETFTFAKTSVKSDGKAAKNKYKKWLKENDDPFKKLANDCLNDVLCHLDLEVNTDIDLSNIDNIESIPIRRKANKDPIPDYFLSTGAKQIMQTTIPLYFLEPNGSIILFDQPESSLFPDIQFMLINEYQKLTTNCQIFYATHSPIVASAFEPWEIFELKFDEPTKLVHQVKYYEGDRLVGNYFKDLRYLKWDSLYMKFFGLKQLGQEEFRNKALMESKRLKLQLDKLRKDKKTKTTEYIVKHERYINIAKKLGWEFTNEKN